MFANFRTSILCSSPATQGGLPGSSRIPAITSLARFNVKEYADQSQNLVVQWDQENIHEQDYSCDIDTKRELVELIRGMLQNMGEGEISICPYNTAWVALVEDMGQPQFPSSLEWISANQLPDGSWGDDRKFLAHDRILNTFACVVALRFWKAHPDKCNRGISFIKENIYKLQNEDEEHMPIGFEVALPSLIEIAKKLDIDIPEDSPGLQEIYSRRDLKLTRIPRDMMHNVATTLLFSLEGMPGLDWQKLLKLQAADGSFLFSPSSTAFAFQQTKDENCLKYLLNCVQKFNGGAPNVYPVDLFEHTWAIDRLQRLGVSRFFQDEIDECIDYVYRYWTNKGICWARNSNVQEIDDTAMGFRLLRLHGYQVSADVFRQFESDEEFFCCVGQSSESVTSMYNMYRASRLMFPGEKILEHAYEFTAKFLVEKRANDELLDKWIITKDLPGEVGYALDVPWYASLPRLETRFFLEQYGGEDDVWIGKTLYRMPYVNNNAYLKLAELDYNNCQAIHQHEWKTIQKWYRNCSLDECGLTERRLLLAYYIAAATVFEPEKSVERLAWAKTQILLETIVSQKFTQEQKRNFVDKFECTVIHHYPNGERFKTRNNLVWTLIRTVRQMSSVLLMMHNKDIHLELHHVWRKWLRTWATERETSHADVELLVNILNMSRKEVLDEVSLLFSHAKYQHLLEVTSRVCHQLRLFQIEKDSKGCTSADMVGITTLQIESSMQELVKLVLTKSTGDLDSLTKQNFLVIAKSFYYNAYCHPRIIDLHMAKVLFERVVCK